MAATCMAVCKGSRKKIRGIFISSCHLPVAVECDIVILSEPGPIPQAPVGQFCRHNLSPRGDGNHAAEALVLVVYLTQLIPARGRKLSDVERLERSALDTTYPREGTETTAFHLIFRASRTQLIPARGRKHILKGHAGGSVWTQLIPARGRKPSTSPQRDTA